MENTEKQVNVFSFSPASSTTAPDGIKDKDSTVVLIYLSKSVYLHLLDCKMAHVFLELEGYKNITSYVTKMYSRTLSITCEPHEKAKYYYGMGMCVCVLYDLLIKPNYIKSVHLRVQN